MSDQSQVVLITGATSGIGKVIAEYLTERGHRVYGTSRSANRTRTTGFELIALEVKDDASVQRAIAHVLEREGRIDVLVNNVGMLEFGSAEETTIEETIEQLEVNFLGAARMTRAVIPILRKQRSGRIINMSSLAGIVALPFNGASSAAKFALEGYSEAVRLELLQFAVYVSLIELSATRSENGETSMRVVQQPLSWYDQQRDGALARMMQDVKAGTLSKQEVAATVLRIMTEAKPRLRYKVGSQARLIPLLKTLLPARIFERNLYQRYIDNRSSSATK
jgi:short-subunit dehydrogenase